MEAVKAQVVRAPIIFRKASATLGAPRPSQSSALAVASCRRRASSVVSRPLQGEVPTIDVALGHTKSNPSPTLELFLSRLDQLVEPGQKH